MPKLSERTAPGRARTLLYAAATISMSACVLTGCAGDGQSATSSQPPAPAPTIDFTVSRASISQGQSVNLAWTSANTTGCTASGSWSGAVPTSGSKSTGPLGSTSQYMLTCKGAGGSANQSVSVVVDGVAAAPTIAMSANPEMVSSGGSSILSWSSTGATSCTASGGWSGPEAVSGTQSTGTLSGDAIYTLICSGPGGSTQQSTAVKVSTPVDSDCAASSGALSLKAKAVRVSGISPLLVFFDATGTNDSSINGNTTAFQDVYYTWNFGDSNASGTGTWVYGSNFGHNGKNTATGGVAAHLYITPGVDTSYAVTVTAFDGSNTASCKLGVSAFDPAGPNGFPGAATTCVSSSGTPLAGNGGCPAGAAVLRSSNISSIHTSMNGRSILFKCGDSFSGGATFGGTKFSIGAYGGCEGSQSNRPVFHGPLEVGTGTVADGRVADIDFEKTGSYAISTTQGTPNGPMTLYNLASNGNNSSYYWAQGTQWGLIQSTQTGEGTSIGTFVNYAENNCVNGSSAYNCGGTPSYNNIAYQAVLGNDLNGQGSSIQGGGIEVLRVSACRLCVIENNTVQNANNVGATLKFHSGNTYQSRPVWIGQYTELSEISDNYFAGESGAQIVEIAPQNGQSDERIRNIVFERNLINTGTTGSKVLVSARNVTARDNVFYSPPGGQTSSYELQIAQRGIEWAPSFVEVYNNTCFNTATCIGFDGAHYAAAGSDGWASNNLFYSPNPGSTVANAGTGNVVSNNTVNPLGDPHMLNASGSFSVISDFTPTANYFGGAPVPVFYDALGSAWSPSWDLGAVAHK